MAIELTLRPTVILKGPWCEREEWEEVFKGDPEALKELFEEDLRALWEDMAGMDIILSARWVEDG